MEAGLILRIECADTAQCDFTRLMLDNSNNRPLDEDDVEDEQRDWFAGLEDIEIPEYVEKKGNTTIEASWTLGGADMEEDVQDILNCLNQCGVHDAFGILEGDEGWFELWTLQKNKISRYETWNGESLEDLIFDQENDNGDEDDEPDIIAVLDRIRKQAISS
jgi:hypothetical protein